MSALTRFFKENKKERANTKYIVSKDFTDEKGKPLEWEIRPITTVENELLRESCTQEVPVKGKKDVTRSRLDSGEYIRKLIAKSIVYPNLNDKELQDSYDASDAEELILAMVDNPGDYDKLGAFIVDFNGFKTMDEEIEKAKN